MDLKASTSSIAILRGGGGGGGGGTDFVSKPDTLRSEDTFEGLLGLCVGPIKGPTEGMQSIKVNGTPIEDVAGKANFKDFSAIFADGDPLKFPQVAKLRLGSAGAPSPINLQIRNLNAAGTPGPWLTHSVNNTGAEAIDLRFIVQQLYKQTEKGIYENTLSLEIQMKPQGNTTWINPFLQNGNIPPPYNGNGYDNADGTVLYLTKQSYQDSTDTVLSAGGASSPYLVIKGKTTSPYVKELRVQVPNEGTYANRSWDIRVRLLEPENVDADPNFEKRTVSWESATAVYTGKLGDHEEWRAFAWLQLYGKASDNFNGVPEIDGVYDTKIVSVPPASVYNPSERTYSGTIWDGSWEKAFTSDPAWIINDAISDPISGLSAFVAGAYLNKWDALELSKWCSQAVQNGDGGLMPRYSLNLFVDQPQKSDEFIRHLAGAVGATAWDNGGGEWRLKVDKPETPVDIFTSETIEGEFIYSHTDVDTRYNDVTVVFLNEEFYFREDRVRVVDQADINTHGRKPTRVVGIGCTSRAQALRWAVLRLRTNCNEFRAVSFTTNRRGKLLERFDQILIADGSLNADGAGNFIRSTGRIVENKGTSIVLRDSVRLETGVTYNLHATVPNANYNPEPSSEPASETWLQPSLTITRAITNTAGQRGDVNELFLSAALPVDVAENANIALEAVGLPSIPKVFRIVDITYGEDGERISVSAIEVDVGKWAAADAATDANIAFVLADGPPAPTAPVGGVLSVQLFPGLYQTGRVLSAHWNRPLYQYADGYHIERRHNDGPWLDLGHTRQEVYELPDPPYGFHEFRIYTVDMNGQKSLPLEASLEVDPILDIPLTGYLTNESHTIASDENGNNYSLADAGGQFVVYSAVGQITTGIFYDIIEEIGCDATIDALGNYVINTMLADHATVLFRATVTGFGLPIDKLYTITKSKGGVNAKLLYTISNRQTIHYDGNTGLPVPTTQTVQFTALKQNTTAVVNWTLTNLNGVNLTPVTTYLSAATGDAVTMTEIQFAAAATGSGGVIVKGTLTDGITLSDQISVIRVNGGADGADGLHNAQIVLYRRASAPPVVPSVISTYTFATGVLTGHNNGWSQTPPEANGQPLYVTVATASSTEPTDTVAGGEWASPVVLTQDGLNAATIYLYKRSASVPALPSAAATYTFATGILANITQGWSQTVPSANGQLLYVTTATALSTGATDVIATTEWAAPTIMAQDGTPGTNGLHNAEVFLYQRATAVPAVPSVNTSYTFATGTLTGQNNGWLMSIPAADGQSLWVTIATASSPDPTDTIASTEWATPVIMAQDGVNAVTLHLHKRSASVPVLPSVTATYTFATGVLSGVNNGWTQSVPTANGDPLYVTTATALASGSVTTDNIPSSEWAAPTILAQDGAPGPAISLVADDLSFDFIDGVAMNINQVITLTAIGQNTNETINWSVSPAVTLGVPSATQRSLSLTNFGAKNSVVITATGQVSGATAAVTLIRNEQTTPTDSIIPDSGFQGVIQSGGTPSDTATWSGTTNIQTVTP